MVYGEFTEREAVMLDSVEGIFAVIFGSTFAIVGLTIALFLS
jgi:hypothetical protein